MKNEITMFSVPRPFVGEFERIQKNAIISWKLRFPKFEIILFGNEVGTKALCDKYGLKHIPEMQVNKFGTPFINTIFTKAQEIAQFDTLCYANSDILFLGNLAGIVRRAQEKFTQFLLVAARWDLKIGRNLDFNADWQSFIKEQFRKHRWDSAHGFGACDLFAFSKGVFRQDRFPRFLLGRKSWDSWLSWEAAQLEIPVVDITKKLKVIHQNHTETEDFLKSKQLKEEKNYNLSQCRGRKRRVNLSAYIWGHHEIREREGLAVSLAKDNANYLKKWGKKRGDEERKKKNRC